MFLKILFRIIILIFSFVFLLYNLFSIIASIENFSEQKGTLYEAGAKIVFTLSILQSVFFIGIIFYFCIKGLTF